MTTVRRLLCEEDGGLQLVESPTMPVNNFINGSFDPFDSYPRTRLARTVVQTLIQHCKPTMPRCRNFQLAKKLSSSLNNCLPILSVGSGYKF